MEEEKQTLYEEIITAGIPTDSHESDLYALATPECRQILLRYKHSFSQFTSQIDGRQWFDIPFAYAPYWEKRVNY